MLARRTGAEGHREVSRTRQQLRVGPQPSRVLHVPDGHEHRAASGDRPGGGLRRHHGPHLPEPAAALDVQPGRGDGLHRGHGRGMQQAAADVVGVLHNPMDPVGGDPRAVVADEMLGHDGGVLCGGAVGDEDTAGEIDGCIDCDPDDCHRMPRPCACCMVVYLPAHRDAPTPPSGFQN